MQTTMDSAANVLVLVAFDVTVDLHSVATVAVTPSRAVVWVRP